MNAKIDTAIAELLDAEARRINTPDFINADPVQFPRRFESLPDIEIAAILCATIAWGNRRSICQDCEKMLRLMDYRPYNYVRECGYDDIHERFNIHRTFFSASIPAIVRSTLLPPPMAQANRIARHGNLPKRFLANSPKPTTAHAIRDACRPILAKQP